MADENEDVTEIAGRGSSDLASGSRGSWPHEDHDDTDKDASAERMAAASSGADDPADASAGDAAGVPVPSEDVVDGSSEAFPPHQLVTSQPRRAVLYDVDGTLVDSSYLHVVAWWEAFRSQGHDIAMTDIHRCIGMGSDQLVETLIGKPSDDAVEAHTDCYAPRLRQLRPFPDASTLLRRTHDAGLVVVLATSASGKEAAHLRAALDADDVIDHMTTSEDAENAKPEPDILLSAIEAADLKAGNCVFVGDSVWDIKACARIDMPCIALLSGGISEPELVGAGAVEIYRDPAHLLEEFDTAVLGRLTTMAEPGG